MLQKYSSYNPKEPVLPCKTGSFGLQNNGFHNPLIRPSFSKRRIKRVLTVLQEHSGVAVSVHRRVLFLRIACQ